MMLVEIKFKYGGGALFENIYDICQLPDKPLEVIFHGTNMWSKHAFEVKDIEHIIIKFTDD